jgi:1,2-diacylglycerol 3-alpha-glucosyltransferase
MKILFVSTRPGLAGVETLIKRMISYLSSLNDMDLTILFITKRNDDEFSNEFVQFLESKCDIYYGVDLLKTYRKLKKKNFEYVYAFSLFPLVFSLLLGRFFFQKAKICCGVYHPLEYCWKHGPKSYIRKLAHKLITFLPAENIFFMSQLTKEKHGLYMTRDFSKSPLIPIMIDNERFKKVVRKPNRQKIISIGKIVNFRTYMFQMVDVCCDLRKNHPELEIEYHIYGDGPLQTKLSDYIQIKRADDFVFLKGLLSYDKLETVFTDAFLFIGCGTAMLEATASGIPALVTLCPSHQPYTYGFFTEIDNGYNLGGPIPDAKAYPFYNKILELYHYTPKEYQCLQHLSQEKANLFSTEKVMKDFITKLKETKSIKVEISLFEYTTIIISYVFWKGMAKIGVESILSSRYCEEDRAF